MNAEILTYILLFYETYILFSNIHCIFMYWYCVVNFGLYQIIGT